MDEAVEEEAHQLSGMCIVMKIKAMIFFLYPEAQIAILAIMSKEIIDTDQIYETSL